MLGHPLPGSGLGQHNLGDQDCPEPDASATVNAFRIVSSLSNWVLPERYTGRAAASVTLVTLYDVGYRR